MKQALVIHGWPVPIRKDTRLCRFLRKNGYAVTAPYLFDGDDFDLEKAVGKLEASLKGRTPSIIVGISMGGLILPSIAKRYPRAKLIFVASGPFFKPAAGRIYLVVRLLASRIGEIGFSLMKKVPDGVYERLGFLGNVDRSRDNYAKYLQIAVRNQEYLKRMKSGVARDVARFLLNVNNEQMLKKLDNPALVIYSVDDLQTPDSLGMELVKNLRKVRIIKTKGDHFKILNDEVFYKMQDFI